MKKWISALGAMSLFFLHQGQADAQTWIACSTCTTDAQFQTSARTAHGSTWGSTLYGVVNPSTGKFLWVQVARQTGSTPLLIPPITGDNFAYASVKPLSITAENGISAIGVLMSSDAPNTEISSIKASDSTAASNGVTVVPLAPTNEERQQIDAIVRISKSSVLLVPDNSTGYFDSYLSSYNQYHPALDSVIFTALTINNPAWTAQSMFGLWAVLRNFWGKGPVGCVVFANGDSACFQVNPMAPGASRVLANSAKNIDGEAISISGDSPILNGGDTSVSVANESPSSGYVSYSMGGGFEKPIVTCVRVNDTVERCTVQPK